MASTIICIYGFGLLVTYCSFYLCACTLAVVVAAVVHLLLLLLLLLLSLLLLLLLLLWLPLSSLLLSLLLVAAVVVPAVAVAAVVAAVVAVAVAVAGVVVDVVRCQFWSHSFAIHVYPMSDYAPFHALTRLGFYIALRVHLLVNSASHLRVAEMLGMKASW